MTDVKELGPLDYRIAITDQQGRPSPEFQRRWDAQRINNGLFITLTFGTGAPTDPAIKDGSEYIDTSTTPYTLYVVRTGAWHKVGPYAFTDLTDVPHSYSGAGLKLVRVNTGATALEFSTIAAALDSIGSVQGDILYRNATGWTVLPPGTASQLLQTGGASANPSWVNAPTSLPSIANNTLLANTSGSAAVPVSTTLTALIDSALGSAQGDIIYRSASGWVVLTPGTSGYLLTTGGASANPSWTAPIAAANPSATASDTAVNGSATTFMRSDAAPAVQKASSSVFGLVKVDGTTITASGGVISGVASVSGANPTATASDTAVNGSAATFMRSDGAPAIQKGSSSQFGVVKVDGTTITSTGGVISGGTNYYAGALTVIQRGTLSSAASSIDFSSLPTGFDDLILVINGRGDTAATNVSVNLRFNGDTGSNYDRNDFEVNNTTTIGAARAGTSMTIGYLAAASATSGVADTITSEITNYNGTTFQKPVNSSSTLKTGTAADSNIYVIKSSGWWRSASAITSASISPSAGNFAAGTQYALYGRGGSNITVNPQPGLPVISETVTSGSQSSVTISSIPSTYRDLLVVVTGRGTASATNIESRITFNGDTGANYDREQMYAFGTSNGTPGNSLAANYITIGEPAAATAPSNVATSSSTTIFNYAGTTFQKTLEGYYGIKTGTSTANNLLTIKYSGWWRSTAAITSLTITASSGNFVDGTVVTVYGIGGSPTATLPVVPPQGRLTLTSGAPVMTADATAQGTIYYAPYVGTLLPVGNIMYRFSQLSYVLNSTAHTSTNLYDVFAYNSSGTITLATGPAWTNSTTRSNAISQDATNGIWVNTSSITLNLSGGTTTTTVAAGQATYLGTFYATANGQTGMAFRPSAAGGGSNSILGLYNAYNRVHMSSRSQDNTAGWTYSSTTWRTTNNSNSNRITYVDGLGQSYITCNAQVWGWGTGSGMASIGCNRDATTGTPAIVAAMQTNGNLNVSSILVVNETFTPSLGLHYIQSMEATIGSAVSSTFYGLFSSTQFQQLHVNVDT